MVYLLKAIDPLCEKGEFKHGKENEDSAYIDDLTNCRIALVSDGMGGIPGGAAASKQVKELLINELHSSIDAWESGTICIEKQLNEILQKINNKIIQDKTCGGATLGLVTKVLSNIHISHTGDTAVYVYYSNGILKKETNDFTNIGAMVDKGIVAEQSKYFTDIRILLQEHIGKENCRFGYKSLPLVNIKYVAIISDGFNMRVADSEMKSIFEQSVGLEQAFESLVRIAKEPKQRAEEALAAKKEKYPGLIIHPDDVSKEIRNDDYSCILMQTEEVTNGS